VPDSISNMSEFVTQDDVSTGDDPQRSEDVAPAQNATEELEAFNQIVSIINKFPELAKRRILQSALTFLGWHVPSTVHGVPDLQVDSTLFEIERPTAFSEDRTSSPKQFVLDKRPKTDVDRVACLAYYLTHYRDTPHFKTLEISKVNTEAGQIKFSNAAKAVDNASSAGLLIQAGKGKKQISAIGELYVQALPDRDAARAAIAHARRRKKSKRTTADTEASL